MGFNFFRSAHLDDSVYLRLIRIPVRRAIKLRGNEVGGLRNAVLNNDRMRFSSAGVCAAPKRRTRTRQD